MSGTAAKVTLTTTMNRMLSQIAASRTLGNSIVLRANISLLAFQKRDNQTISNMLGVCAKTVGLWRRRWRDSYEALLKIQFIESEAGFQRVIELNLADAPRSGAPGKFLPEQVVGLIGCACESPENCGRPVTTWTGRELADEVQKRGLIDSISPSHVSHILREVDLKPHRSRYWCNTTEKDSERFQQQVVCLHSETQLVDEPN